MKTTKQASGLKSYITPWETGLILACKRCQRKLRKQHRPPEFANLKKWVKARRRAGTLKSAPHIIAVPCLKICPKGGIVVFDQSQLAANPAQFSIIRNVQQVEVLCKANEPNTHCQQGS